MHLMYQLVTTSSISAGQYHEWTFCLLKIGDSLLLLHVMQKRLHNLDCVLYVGVAMDKHSTLLIKVPVK